MPVPGWLALSAGDKASPFFGLELPALVSPEKALARQVQGLHETIDAVGYQLTGLHAVAAQYHHYYYCMHGDSLRRTLPQCRKAWVTFVGAHAGSSGVDGIAGSSSISASNW
jgi:cytochrome b561